MVKRSKWRWAAMLAGAMIGMTAMVGCGRASGRTEAGGAAYADGQSAAGSGLSGADGAQGDGSGGAAGTAKETVITGAGNSVSVTGSGAVAEGCVVTISSPGTYRLSGVVDDGQVRIDAGKEDEIHLILDGFSITNSDSAAIYAVQSRQVTITTESGTENTVTDGAEYVFEKEGEDEPDAAIFSKDDLVLDGEGVLTVNGLYQDGIRSKDDLTLQSGTYQIQAVNDGLKGKDSVTVTGGSLTVAAGGDGIQSSNDTEEGKGEVSVAGGDLTITSGKKGILAATLIRIQGGGLQIEAEDDALHSDGDVKISGGTLVLSSADDAIHADRQVAVDDGEILIEKSYEGIEGLCVDINGGEITLASEDDGINAAGGVDSSGNAGNGRDNPFAAAEGAYIRITGGTLRVNASGDGIDANGDFFMEGGDVYVEGPVNDGNGTLDYNGEGTITGGSFLGVGSSGMLQAFSEDSGQPVIMVYYAGKQSAGTTVSLLDGSQKVLLEETPSKEFSSAVISTPDLKAGENYQVKTGETVNEISIDRIVNEIGERPVQGGFGGGRMGGGARGGTRGAGGMGSVNGAGSTGGMDGTGGTGDAGGTGGRMFDGDGGRPANGAPDGDAS